MYPPYCAGVDKCYGNELYLVNGFHNKPLTETTAAVTPDFQPRVPIVS